MAGGSRRDFLRALAGVGGGIAASGLSGCTRRAARAMETSGAPYAGGLVCPRLEVVRFGFIGVGARGSGHVKRALVLEGVEVTAIADPHVPSAKRSAERCVAAGRRRPALYTAGDHDYRKLLERDDVDAVIIATPWLWHAPQAAEAMEAGKHAFVEVPMATTVEDLWRLVDTAEKTRRHCMMMENVCYGREELLFLNLCRQGVLGELLHGEGAYIHDLRGQMRQIEHGTGSWRTPHHTRRNGNLYPTHGLGPIAQYMSIDRGEDRFHRLVSLSSPARGRQLYARKHFPPDHPRNRVRYVCGDMNTSLIHTVKGRTIVVQHDTTTPRPYTRHNLIQGTKGCLAGFPMRAAIEGRGSTHRWTQGDPLRPLREAFEHPLWKRVGKIAARAGGHGGMDFLMLWRLVHCLREGKPLDQNVYEGASWSVVSPLSEQSVARGGEPVAFPDFTRGRWRSTAPLGVVT